MQTSRLATAWTYIRRYWSSVAALVSVVGYLLLSLFPNASTDFRTYLIFLGANALIWTVIELKLRFDSAPYGHWYPSLRAARHDLVSAMRRAIKRSRRKPLRIYVLGGRLRTISDMLEEIFEEILHGHLPASNLTVLIGCLNPSEMRSWVIDSLKDHPAFAEKTDQYAEDLRLKIDELTRYNQNTVFQSNSIEIAVVQYNSFPAYYAFVIGHTEIFWGYYTWNVDNEDFDGPVNPCFRIRSSDETFELLRNWFVNTWSFLQIAAPSTVSLRPAPESPTSAERSDALEHALRTNQVAYDTLASFYAKTGRPRAERMQEWLEPVYAELASRSTESASVLELGPGDGSLAQMLGENGYQVTAIDFSPRMCETVKRTAPEVKLIEGEFLQEDFGEQRFDAIVAVAFVHLFPSPWDGAVVRKLRSLLGDQGIAYLATTLHQIPEEGYSPKSEPPGQPIRYRKRYKREQFERLLIKSGLRIIEAYDNEDGFVRGKVWMNWIVEASAEDSAE